MVRRMLSTVVFAFSIRLKRNISISQFVNFTISKFNITRKSMSYFRRSTCKLAIKVKMGTVQHCFVKCSRVDKKVFIPF